MTDFVRNFSSPFAANNLIAVVPFRKDIQTKINERSRLASIAQKTELARTEVVYGTVEIPTGSIVFLEGEAHHATRAAQVYKVEHHKPFVLVPVSYVKVVFPPGVAIDPPRPGEEVVEGPLRNVGLQQAEHV